MKLRWTAIGLSLFLVLLLAGGVQAVNIFVWQHDNGQTAYDQVFRQNLTATQSVTRTLDELEMDYTLNRSLPEDLSNYDLMMTCLSWYCDL